MEGPRSSRSSIAISSAGLVELVRHASAGARGDRRNARPPTPTSALGRRSAVGAAERRARVARASKYHAPTSRIDEREEAVQAVDPAALLVGVAEEAELRERRGRGTRRRGRPHLQFPQHAQIAPITISELPDVHDQREAAVRVERALARATDVCRDRERLDQHADHGDRAARRAPATTVFVSCARPYDTARPDVDGMRTVQGR